MTTKYAELYNPAQTPQTERADPAQVENNAGGYSFAIDMWARLERFLILGSDSQTYYQSARSLTRENAEVVATCWLQDPLRTAKTIVDISSAGRAPRNSPAIFALALGVVSSDETARRCAYAAVNGVCRTGTHIFEFVSTAMALGKGWGRGMKNAVAGWYTSKPVDKLAYQVIKYRQRAGLTHENLLDLSHAKSGDDAARSALYEWIVGRLGIDGDIVRPASFPQLIVAHELAMTTEKASELLPIVAQHSNLPWEALPTWANADADVQKALLPSMPLTALIRNLGNLTRIGAIKPMSSEEQIVTDKLTDEDYILKSRVHPMAVLFAMKTYASGRGFRGANVWDPIQNIVDALDRAFYMSFGNVPKVDKRVMLALDVSGSMSVPIMDSNVSCREASSAMALVTMANTRSVYTVGFTSGARDGSAWARSGITPLKISAGQRLDDVCRYTASLPFGGTDCSLPMLHAIEKNIEVDTFVIYTDSETWAGTMHPHKALERYRRKMGINAKLIVVGMVSNGFSIANPDDQGMLDVVGFDTSTPSVIAHFS